MAKNILLVDDDALMRRSLTFNLERAGFSVRAAASAEDGILMIRKERPDIVLLDIGLPGMDGLEALRQIRDQLGVPVILLTARRRELDEIMGLELGADDYVTKPFDVDVLLAHIKAVLRRTQAAAVPHLEPEIIQVGDLSIDPGAHEVILRKNKVDLAPREFDLLYSLAINAGKLVTTEDLLAQVWGAEYQGQPQVVYVHIRWLREKLESDPMHPSRIVTVRGLGYKYIPGEEKHAQSA